MRLVRLSVNIEEIKTIIPVFNMLSSKNSNLCRLMEDCYLETVFSEKNVMSVSPQF